MPSCCWPVPRAATIDRPIESLAFLNCNTCRRNEEREHVREAEMTVKKNGHNRCRFSNPVPIMEEGDSLETVSRFERKTVEPDQI